MCCSLGGHVIGWCRLAVSRSPDGSHEGMESYLLALQLRAAQEVVGEEMPRRALVAKMILFGEVASALLMIQLGQFTHAGLIMVPFFLASLLAIHREHWSRSIELPDPRTVLVSVLSAQHYSLFGLRRKQGGVARFVWSTMLLRGLCLLPLLLTLAGECAKPGCIFHFCWYRGYWELITHERADMRPDCSWPTQWIPDFDDVPPNRSSDLPFMLAGRSRNRIRDWCKRNETTWPCVPTSMRSSSNVFNSILLWPTSTLSSNFSGICSKDFNLVPAMARHSCVAGAWDPILYQICLQDALLPNICNPTFLVCSYLTSDHLEVEDFLVLSYIFIPGAGLFLTFVSHIFAFFFGNVRTMQVPENAQLRRAVHRRTMQLQEQLQNGQLDNSLWWSRRMLESKLLFFAADIVLDAICCMNFFLAESYEFAACQLVIIIFSAVLQFRTTDIRTTWKAVENSWQTGLANNALHVILLQEKTCEAPLSLFFQFFAAFYLNDEWWTFVSLWLSMLFSILGIANGLYIRNHLTPFDLETLEEEQVCRPKTPPATVGLPSWPSDQTMQGIQEMQGPSCLPPPPGLPALLKEGRKPGQYASATEWIWTTMTLFLAQFIDPYAPAG